MSTWAVFEAKWSLRVNETLSMGDSIFSKKGDREGPEKSAKDEVEEEWAEPASPDKSRLSP